MLKAHACGDSCLPFLWADESSFDILRFLDNRGLVVGFNRECGRLVLVRSHAECVVEKRTNVLSQSRDVALKRMV